MAVLSWLSFGLCALLAVVCFVLYLDSKGRQRALSAALARVAALQVEVAGLARAGERRDVAAAPARRAVLLGAPAMRAPDVAAVAPVEVAEDGRHTIEIPAPPRPARGVRATLLGLAPAARSEIPRSEIGDEQRAMNRLHCRGPACTCFDCRCACDGCVGGRGER